VRSRGRAPAPLVPPRRGARASVARASPRRSRPAEPGRRRLREWHPMSVSGGRTCRWTSLLGGRPTTVLAAARRHRLAISAPRNPRRARHGAHTRARRRWHARSPGRTTAAIGVMMVAGASSERRPPRQDRAGAAEAVTVAAVEVPAVAAGAVRRQVVAAGAEEHRVKTSGPPMNSGARSFFHALRPHRPRRPYRLRFPIPRPHKKCTA
jgi:hypothetical protein